MFPEPGECSSRIASFAVVAGGAPLEVDHQQRVVRLIRHVGQFARGVDRRAARLAAGFDLADHHVLVGVDERDGAAVLVAHEGKPRVGESRHRYQNETSKNACHHR